MLALQEGLPAATRRARCIEGHGYYRRPPRSGRKVLMLSGSLDKVDESAIRAMRPIVEEHVTVAEMLRVKRSYLASELGDAYWIAWDCDLHPHVVITILRNLEARGELTA